MFTIIIAGAIVMEIVIQRETHSRASEDCIYIEAKHGLFNPVAEYLVFTLLRPQILIRKASILSQENIAFVGKKETLF